VPHCRAKRSGRGAGGSTQQSMQRKGVEGLGVYHVGYVCAYLQDGKKGVRQIPFVILIPPRSEDTVEEKKFVRQISFRISTNRIEGRRPLRLIG